MELKADKFIKDCKVTKEDWQTYLDRGTLEHIVANMLMTYHQEQVKKLNIDDVSKSVICENYINGFYADYGTDLCENCGERKGKHN